MVDTLRPIRHNTCMDKHTKISAILEIMEDAYAREGIEGDFDDARRYYMTEATVEEINADYEKWCKQM